MSNAHDNQPVAAGAPQESYIVAEGKKHGSTRDVRPEAAHDKYYTVLRVHPGDAFAAYPGEARSAGALAFVPPGDPKALAGAVSAWASDRNAMTARRHAARHLFESRFSTRVIREQVARCLE